MRVVLSFVMLFTMGKINAQKLPYYEIPEAPKEYTQGTVAARMVDGLGFRYYWATEGLKPKDLSYKPNQEARSVRETLEHLLVLSVMTLSAVEGKEVVFEKSDDLVFDDLRKKTLQNFKKTSDILKKSNDLSKFVMKIPRGDNTAEFPFWNQLNGPIADAIWHVGQIVSFRRSSGNPFPKGVSLLTGKVKK
ncbi:hypothetical protein SAMN04489761_1278 [Tenacibaculum sp. MAR_2009_124]|uniref:DinB family protein n=1 Tax=Tenacibaculum sp. MAR_2009_124 TaxID=1250059 RepID=UPI0008952182|nr:hypothetical protein [Tenacibaculum sp. MAR_2009_124]SEB53805.1 hypothetical protein SAMN04489761_1278 [Tenacibaculum sp. MAR_2009_124]